jgi:hypothetical protein
MSKVSVKKSVKKSLKKAPEPNIPFIIIDQQSAADTE